MKKMSLSNAKQLSKAEMKQIMAGSGEDRNCMGAGSCNGACFLMCNGHVVQGICRTSNLGNCLCGGAC